MIGLNSVALYKNRPALVTGVGEKIEISVLGGEKLRVREKDLEPLHPGPVTDLRILEKEAPSVAVEQILSARELLEGNNISLKELAELVYGSFSPANAWAAWNLVQDGLYFTGSLTNVRARSAAEVEAEEQKRGEKERGQAERDAFLERIRQGRLELPEDGRFLQDVEALARGKTDKSRTLKDLGKPETPLEAHRLLLSTGVWTGFINPHPDRFGLSLASATIVPPPPPEEERLDLTHLRSFAVDNAWSGDPDDAVSLEGNCLYVHVADVAASIPPGSAADREARGRGSTLYLPEGASRMLAEDCLPLFALGLSEISPALSFKMTLNKDFSLLDTEIVPSWVKVTRLTYEEADAIAAGELAGLFALAEANLERRLNTGAVDLEFPEVHISIKAGTEGKTPEIEITPVQNYKSAAMVRECMLLAGEGAAKWALQRKLPFTFISQEAGDLPAREDILPGLAGSYQIRRCMRPRQLSIKPGIHWGLGLDEYSQVTSPLRRYTDLLAHQQIRAFLKGEAPLGPDEVLAAMAASEAAASATVHAERASRAHWTAVYLSDKKDRVFDGVMVDKKGSRAVLMIPALGLETQVPLRGKADFNDTVRAALSSVRIPEAEALFTLA
ncbi:exoribonuclease II [Spirochaetia bacterium]|nr:exoribonuclease II [Spirochaetia bacterium]